VRAIEDRVVLDLLVERGVCLDVCPSSNVSLQIAPSIEKHPLPRLLEAGVTLTLNSDGPLFSGVTVNDEYRLAHEVFGFDREVLADIARTSLTVSSCPKSTSTEALGRIDGWSVKERGIAAR
jgi:adenosine deaminase